MINFCNLNSKHIDGIFDTTPTKIGGFAPGTSIPILDYKSFNKINPKYCVLFAWNHFNEILLKEKNKNIKWLSHINKKYLNCKNIKNIISPNI